MAADRQHIYLSYLCREQLFGTLVAEANKVRSKRGDDPALIFWRALGYGYVVRWADVF